jgi:hypothetical protein
VQNFAAVIFGRDFSGFGASVEGSEAVLAHCLEAGSTSSILPKAVSAGTKKKSSETTSIKVKPSEIGW